MGWPANLPRLTDWHNNGISIQPNAAVAVMCSGAALILLSWGPRLAAAGLGVIVGLIGASTLLQYVAGLNLDFLNTLLMFDRTWGRVGVIYPGRMGPPGATCWTLIGIALVFVSIGTPETRRTAPLIALFTLVIAALSVTGYLYGVDTLYSLPYLTVIAFQTATFIAAVSAAIIAAVPECPPMRWLLDSGATGQVARRIVPFIVAAPLMLGWLRLRGEAAGLFETRFGVAILVLSLIVLLLSVLSWSLRTISQHEIALRESERRNVEILESITDGFVTLDRDWRFVFVNPEAARLMRRSRSER